MAPLLVMDLMTREVATLRPEQNLNVAAIGMEVGRVRHLPVVNADGSLAGLVTHRDLLRAQIGVVIDISEEEKARLMRKIPAREVMTTGMLTVTPDATALYAAELMLEHKIGCLPVVDQGKLVGIITEADFLEFVVSALARQE